MFRKIFNKKLRIFKNKNSIFLVKKFTTSSTKVTKNFKFFSTLTFLTLGSLLLKNKFYANQKQEIKDDEFGFLTYTDTEWILQSSYEGDSQKIVLSKPNEDLSIDNFEVIICEPVPSDLDMSFEKYVQISIEQIKGIQHMDPTVELKSMKNKTKKNSKGHKYEEITYTVHSKTQKDTSKLKIVIFFQNNIAIAIQSSNEISRFKEGTLDDIIDNMDFFKPIPKIDYSPIKYFKSDFLIF